MKNMLNAMLVGTVAVIGLAGSARAGVVLGPSSVWWPGSGGTELEVTYEVDLSGSTYTYSYVITPPVGYGIDSFTVDLSEIVPLANVNSTASQFGGYSIVGGQSVTWNFNDLTTAATVTFTSQYSPPVLGMGTASASGVTGSWSSPDSDIPTPGAPVPEASTVFAGLAMVLPLGVATFRAVRRSKLMQPQHSTD